MEAEMYADQFRVSLDLHDLLSDRSRHGDEGGIGASNFGCREEMRRILVKAERTDSPEKFAALVGGFIDSGVKQARRQFNAALILDADLTVTMPNGFTFPVHPDEIDPDEPSVTDYKGLALDTPIPTPGGWTTMGQLAVGDRVFGSDGQPCTVQAKSAVKNIGTYVVTFGDGSTVVCDPEHYWWVLDGYPPTLGRPVVRDIEEIRDRLHSGSGTGQQVNFRVPNARPLDLPDVDLPIHPWALGAWLGDGSRCDATVTIGVQDAEDASALWAAAGWPLGPAYQTVSGCSTYPIAPAAQERDAATGRMVPNGGFRSRLVVLGILGDKAVPPLYLRASVDQRTALVRGLMDTDGSWNGRRRRAVYITTSKQLADDMYELLCSLGERPNVDWRTVTGFGVQTERCAIEWTPLNFNPFLLPRKAAKVAISDQQRAKASQRTIVAVEPGPDVPTACIAVDSPNRTYLCGKAMIPTHNTKDGLAAIRRGLADEQYRFQRHIQYLAAHQAGLVPADGVVRNVFLDRSGSDPHPHVEQEPFSPQVIAEATDWLDDVLYAVKHDERASQDRPRVWCKDYCPFYTDCRGAEIEIEDITDPRLTAMVDELGAAVTRNRADQQLIKELKKAGLAGLTGRTERTVIVSKWINSEKQTPHYRVEVEEIAS